MNKQFILLAAAVAASLASCNSVELIDAPLPGEPEEESRLIGVEVLDFSPAPGQFVNLIPAYSAGDSRESMRLKAEKALNSGNEVSLGAFGGSITLKLSEPIDNNAAYDFRIRGNALIAGVDADSREYGSCEPGIVEVMCDENGNGLPDETWYELKGVGYGSSTAYVTVTYHAPAADATDEKYIRWEASDGTEGWLPFVRAFHDQPYWPQWLSSEGQLSFKGRRLPDNGIYNSATGRFDLYNMQGYADAYPDNSEKSALDISSAVDADGRFVRVDRIHFVRITTGILQVNGPLGECSTEVAGVEVLKK